MEYPNSVPENPLVSVCIQTYNHSPYIAQCIEGALMQETDFPYEIIIGEDESTDGTREICIEYAKKYPEKIRLFLRREEDKIWINGVKTGRFNFVENLKASRGKYIALCEGDDYWVDKEKLQKQVDFLEEKKSLVLCFHDSVIIDENDAVISESRLNNIHSDFTSDHMRLGAMIPPNTTLFRNVPFSFDEYFYKVLNADTYLWGLLGLYGSAGYISGIKNSAYRIHRNGIWGSKDDLYKSINHINLFRQVYLREKRSHLANRSFDKYYSKIVQFQDVPPKSIIARWKILLKEVIFFAKEKKFIYILRLIKKEALSTQRITKAMIKR